MPRFSVREKIDVISLSRALTIMNPRKQGLNQRRCGNIFTALLSSMKRKVSFSPENDMDRP